MGTKTKVTIGGHSVRFERRKVGDRYQNVYKPHVGTNGRLSKSQTAANVYIDSLIKGGVSRYGSISQFKAASTGIKSMKVLSPIKGLTALSSKIAARKASLKAAIKSRSTAVKQAPPAIISQQISKASRIPYIIGGVLIAVYMLFKKRGKK